MHATLTRAVARKSEFGPRDDQNPRALIALFKLRGRRCGGRALGVPIPEPGEPRAPPWRGEASRARRRGHISHRGPPITSRSREQMLERRAREAGDGQLPALVHRQRAHAEYKSELADSLSPVWLARSRYLKGSHPARAPSTRGPSWKMHL